LGEEKRAAYFIEWNTGQKARALPFLHRPDVCLPMAGCDFAGRFAVEPVRVGELELEFEGYTFTRRGQELHVFRLVWDADEAREVVTPAEDSGWTEALAQRWDDVRSRKVRVRVQICTYAIMESCSREHAVAAFREEIVGFLKAKRAGQ